MKARSHLKKLTPYQPGMGIDEVKKAYGVKTVVKLASNENPYGCSEEVVKALHRELSNLFLYPSANADPLRQKMASYYQISPECLLFGKGTDEIIHLLARAFLNQEVNTVMSDFTFPQYKKNAVIEGAEIREIPHVKGKHDIPRIIEAVDQKTSIVWICNPNNPSGEYVNEKELLQLLNEVDSDTLVVCDEAYFEYVDAIDFPDTVSLIDRYPNLVVTRTFSKAYGLAALRIGYCIAHPDVISLLQVVKDTFNTSHLAQVAALAALNDQHFVHECKRKNRQELEEYYTFCWRFGLSYYPSQTNFIFIELRRDCDKIAGYLLTKGYIVRSGSTWGSPTGLRITIGDSIQNDTLIAYLTQLLRTKDDISLLN
ncbi:histidinol-phosphate transaminase [Desmospora profundinema]|uniref:Histidinol-phosphate aminotransferase n=1 Tax=Desmospora profundinema TaxID=1571184 RepID=A0ABU1IMP6_9BACL|nr:histidinol-phosphate transaminase [Desmospora profundinema]MDR6226013.1 histidinol-phosphate aminotransferase [Desmospora profundinema]